FSSSRSPAGGRVARHLVRTQHRRRRGIARVPPSPCSHCSSCRARPLFRDSGIGKMIKTEGGYRQGFFSRILDADFPVAAQQSNASVMEEMKISLTFASVGTGSGASRSSGSFTGALLSESAEKAQPWN